MVATSGRSRFDLFQFWHNPTPPADVAALLDAWARDPALRRRLFDAEAAAAYIGAHLGARARAAFLRCAVPAMQADLFRYCALFAEGGAYLDADSERRGGIAPLLEAAARGLLASRQDGERTNVINGFMFVRASRDPLFERVLGTAVRNIEGRVSNNVWEVTGPGIMTALHADPATRGLFDGFEIRPKRAYKAAFAFVDLPYKAGAEDWRVSVYFPGSGATIFR